MWHWQDPSPCLLPSPLQWPFPLQGRSAPPWHAVGTRAHSQHTRQAARAQPSLSAHHPTALWLSLTRAPLHAKASRLWGQRPASRVRASGQPQLKHGARVLTHGVWDRTGQRGHAPVAPGRWDISKGRQEAAVAREGSELAGLPLRAARMAMVQPRSPRKSRGHRVRGGTRPHRMDGPVLLRAGRRRGPRKAHPLHSGGRAGWQAGRDPQAGSQGSLGPRSGSTAGASYSAAGPEEGPCSVKAATPAPPVAQSRRVAPSPRPCFRPPAATTGAPRAPREHAPRQCGP